MPVRLTINNQPVTAPDGATILEAAKLAGIRIPTLCHHPDLSNVGACRMCVVSVEKARALQTACTTPVFEGMVVDSKSPEAKSTRRFVLETLLSDHPNECMKCEVNGDCELQDLVYEYDVPWPDTPGERHHYPIDPDPNPFIFIDRNKCILCSRCVRACGEIQNRDVWNFAHRGFKSKLVAGADQTLLDAALRELRPVRRLLPRRRTVRQDERRRRARQPDHQGAHHLLVLRRRLQLRSQCAQRQDRAGHQRARCAGQRHGHCVKGRYGYDYVHHPDRLKQPLVRRYLAGPERPAKREWPMAALRPRRRCTGRRGKRQATSCPDPAAHQPSLPAIGLRRGRLGHGARHRGAQVGRDQARERRRRPGRADLGQVHQRRKLPGQQAHQAGASAPTISTTVRASLTQRHRHRSGDKLRQRRHDQLDPRHRRTTASCIFIIGSNTTEQHPVIGIKIRQRQAARGAKLIVGRPAPHRHRQLRRPAPAPQAGHRYRPAQRPDAHHPARGLAGRRRSSPSAPRASRS